MSHIPVTWLAGIYTTEGYAEEARAYLRALEAAGAEPRVADLPFKARMAQLTDAEMRMLVCQQQRLVREPHRPTVIVQHYQPTATSAKLETNASVHAFRTMFETDGVPSRWMPYLMSVDEIWVPTQFNVRTFSNAGIPPERLRVLHQTIDFDLFDPDRPSLTPMRLNGVGDSTTVFLSTFAFDERKGWRQLLTAWARAFTALDDVRLVLKAGVFRNEGEAQKRVQAFLDDNNLTDVAPIEIIDRGLTAEEMVSLYAAADAFVLPTRGEGWGRPIMEALAMRLPTIASNWSAQLEFMDPDHCWLIPGRLVAVDGDLRLWQDCGKAGHRWFEADVDAIRDAMRDIAADPAAARVKAAPHRDLLTQRFSSARIAEQIISLSDDLWARRGSFLTRPVGRIDLAAEVDPATFVQVAGAWDTGEQIAQAHLQLFRSPQQAPTMIRLPEGHTIAMTADEHARWPALPDRERQRIDLAVVSRAGRRDELLAGGFPAGKVLIADCSAPEGRLQLAQELRRVRELPPGSQIAPAQVEARQLLVAYKPDMSRPAEVRSQFTAWCQALGDEDPVTLAVFCAGGPQQTDETISLIEAVCEDIADVPDLTIVEPHEDSQWENLVIASAAVLANGADDPFAARHSELLNAARLQAWALSTRSAAAR